jgi:hypothetical protein
MRRESGKVNGKATEDNLCRGMGLDGGRAAWQRIFRQ